MVCELKAAQTALLLVRKYVADESGADALLDWLKPYEAFTFREGPEPDFVALHKQIGKSVMPKTDDPWGQALIDSMVLLIKEELHHFWQVREAMLARDIPYVKITASNGSAPLSGLPDACPTGERRRYLTAHTAFWRN